MAVALVYAFNLPILKMLNADKDYLRLFPIVTFVVESDSGVKCSLEMGQGGQKGDFES